LASKNRDCSAVIGLPAGVAFAFGVFGTPAAFRAAPALAVGPMPPAAPIAALSWAIWRYSFRVSEPLPSASSRRKSASGLATAFFAAGFR